MTSPMERHALRERALTTGVQLVTTVTRRTVAHARPPASSRLQRLSAPLVLVPAFVIMLAVAAILLVVLVAAALFLAARSRRNRHPSAAILGRRLGGP